MNWRRGLLLAGINLAVAIPLMFLLHAQDVAWFRDRAQHVPQPPVVETPPAASSQTSDAREDTIAFNPCSMTGIFTLEEGIVVDANMPVFVLTAWRSPCPASWTLSGRLHAHDPGTFEPSSLAAQRKVDAGMLLLMILQWLVLGAFPMKGPRSWREPGMFITLCSVLAAILFFIHLEDLARLSGVFVALTWLWWLCLAVWRLIRPSWRRFARRNAQPGQPI